MKEKNSVELLFTLLITMIVVGVFIFIALNDRDHGDFGGSFGPGEINSTLILDQGHMEDPSMPEGLLMVGAGQSASVKFEVFNIDPDNDIDTIEISIPGATIVSGSYEWYKTGATHEWTYTISGSDVITFTARDDFTGSEAGDVIYYDTAGNIDDALDFIEDFDDGDNPVYDLSEGITLSVTFTAGEPGFKMGADSIGLRVGDLKTEDPGAPLTSFMPYPYPYIVAGDGDSFLLIVLRTPTCVLEVEYGGQQLFTQTRAGNFLISDFGFEFTTYASETVAVLEDPGDTPVKPLVSAREDNLTGQFVLDIYMLTVTDVEAGTLERTTLVNDYSDDIPPETGVIVDNDIDDDGRLNLEDDDIDGDEIPNSEDLFPEIYNRLPVVTGITENLTVKENEAFTLVVNANDPDNDALSYRWTNDQDPGWNKTGPRVDLSGLEPGAYLFTVEIKDALGNTRTESIRVTIIENLPPSVTSVTADRTKINVGEDVTLTVNATDPEDSALNFVWTHDKDTMWQMTGNPVTIPGLDEGEFTFTVTVSDGNSNATGTIKITVTGEEDGFSWVPFMIVAIVAVLLIVIVLVVVIIGRKKKGASVDDMIGEHAETGAAHMDMTSPEASYEDFYNPDDPTLATGSYSPDAPLEFYPEEPADVPIEESHGEASVMEYPADTTPELPRDDLTGPVSSPPAPSDEVGSSPDGPDTGQAERAATSFMPPPPPPPMRIPGPKGTGEGDNTD